MNNSTSCCCISNEEAHKIFEEMQHEAKIQELEQKLKERKWISVKDRLPDNIRDVIVCDEFGLVYPAYYHAVYRCWMYGFIRERCGHRITHWMPLPQKPESEDDAE